MSYRNNNAEGSAPGTTVAASQSGSGNAFDLVSINGSGTAIYTSDSSMHGNQSYYITTTTSTSDTSILAYTGANDLSAAIRFYFCMVGKPSGAVQIGSLRNSGGNAAAINTTGTFKPQLIDNLGAVAFTFINPLVSGVWYRIELAITVDTATTGSCTFAYYLGDATTPLENTYTSSVLNFGTLNLIGARAGKLTNAGASTTMYFDDFAFNNGSASLIGGFSPTATSAWLGA